MKAALESGSEPSFAKRIANEGEGALKGILSGEFEASTGKFSLHVLVSLEFQLLLRKCCVVSPA